MNNDPLLQSCMWGGNFVDRKQMCLQIISQYPSKMWCNLIHFGLYLVPLSHHYQHLNPQFPKRLCVLYKAIVWLSSIHQARQQFVLFMSWNLRQYAIFFPVVMLLWRYAAVILEIKAQLVSVGPLEAWDISTLTAPTSVGRNFLASVLLPAHQKFVNVVKKMQQCVWWMLHRSLHEGSLQFIIFGMGDFCPPPPTPHVYLGCFT